MDSKFLHEQRKLSTTYQGNQRIVGFKWYFTMSSLNAMHYDKKVLLFFSYILWCESERILSASFAN